MTCTILGCNRKIHSWDVAGHALVGQYSQSGSWDDRFHLTLTHSGRLELRRAGQDAGARVWESGMSTVANQLHDLWKEHKDEVSISNTARTSKIYYVNSSTLGGIFLDLYGDDFRLGSVPVFFATVVGLEHQRKGRKISVKIDGEPIINTGIFGQSQ